MAENPSTEQVRGVEWEGVTFNPKASILRKLLSSASFGFYEYREPDPILHNAYGNILLGELVALMGPSGAGKSSLMKCLTEGIRYNGFSGNIITRGIEEKIRGSIIHQDEKEHLILSLTVTETLMYASQLKNRYWCPLPNFHENNVQGLLKQLGLDNKANTQVSKCSGGERKRLAIGVELTEERKPHILFLDEPTTGLDSSVAFSVIKSLREFAEKNDMAVVATIHQPSEEILNLFHKAIILSSAGAVVYQGNPNVTILENFLNNTIPTFHNISKESFKCSRNPADNMIGLASSIRRNFAERQDRNERGHKSCCGKLKSILLLNCTASDFQLLSCPFSTINGTIYANGLLGEIFVPPVFEREEARIICQRMIDRTRNIYRRLPAVDHHRNYSYEGLVCRTTSSVGSYLSLYGFWTLLKRTWKLRVVMGINGLILRLFIYLMVVAMTTRLYSRDIGKDGGCVVFDGPGIIDPKNCTCFETIEEIQSESAVTSNIKLIFFFLLFLSLESLLNVTLTFPTEFKLFLHEFQNGWYSAPSYFFAKFLVEIPAQLVIPTAYAIYFYSYTQQEGFSTLWETQNSTVEGERFKIYLRANYFCGFIAQGLGFFIGILCVNSISRAILLSSGTLLGLSFFCGFFKKRVAMTDGEQFITTFSFLRYGLETMLLSIYGRKRCEPPKQSYALQSFGINDEELWDNWVGFFRLMAITWGVTFIMLQLKASKWFLFKVIRHCFVVIYCFVEKWVIRVWKFCFCGFIFNPIMECIRKLLLTIWQMVRCAGVIFIWYFVILGVFPTAVYIAVSDFYGAWK